jgi:hypothetical protein
MQKQEGCDEEGESLHVASKTKRTKDEEGLPLLVMRK